MTLSKKNINDPFQQREASKYENPVPSREFILEFLASENRPVGHEEMCGIFQLGNDDEIEALRRRLIAMARDHQLNSLNNEYTILEEADLIEGRVQGNKEGHGFLLRQNDDDIFLSSRQMQSAMDGDLVTVRLSGRNVKGRLDGIVVEVLERKNHRVIGRYYEESQVSFVTPENPRIAQDILVSKESGLTPKHGQYVVIELLTFPEKGQAATGIVTQVLGDFMAPGLEIDIAIHKFDIPNDWPAAVLQQVKHFGFEVEEGDKVNRVDLRSTPFVTIDGEDARDFDDAVYCEKTPGGWKLFVEKGNVPKVNCRSAHLIAGKPRLFCYAEIQLSEGFSIYAIEIELQAKETLSTLFYRSNISIHEQILNDLMSSNSAEKQKSMQWNRKSIKEIAMSSYFLGHPDQKNMSEEEINQSWSTRAKQKILSLK